MHLGPPPRLASGSPMARAIKLILSTALCLLVLNQFLSPVFERWQTPASTSATSSSDAIGPKAQLKQRDNHAEELMVCIIGNAEKRADALKMHQMWQGKFRSFWAIWGDEGPKTAKEDVPATKAGEQPITYLRSADGKSSWAEGMLSTLTAAKEKGGCTYFFTHDDDLKFYPTAAKTTSPISTILLSALKKYQPAVLAFPWQHGDETILGMKAMAEKYKDQEVSPLTGFDSGMVLYHTSIVDFYIPFAPRGEGGFQGKWSLCAVFLNMFTASAFRGQAIRLNALRYDNLINIDNTPIALREKPVALADGTVQHSESRHPYEYRYNKQYSSFLAEGLHDPQSRHGRDLLPSDVTWEVTAGHPPFKPSEVALRLASFYDLAHPGLRDNVYLASHFSKAERAAINGCGGMEVSMHLFTAPDRRAYFDSLWRSLEAAKKVEHAKIHLYIHLAWQGQAAEEYLPYYQSLTSVHGLVTVHAELRSREPRHRYLEAWTPTKNNAFGVFLDDNVVVAPGVFHYITESVKEAFYNFETRRDHLFGISLHPMIADEVNARPFTASTNAAAYLMQASDLMGGIYAASTWQKFMDWYLTKKDGDVLIPYSATNRWPHKMVWRKYLLRFFYDMGYYMLFPNFANEGSMVKFSAVTAATPSLSGSVEITQMGHQMALISSADTNYKLGAADANLQLYDTMHKAVNPSVKLSHDPNNFDKCTMIITVYDRYKLIQDRLKHYHTMHCLDAIVIIWNNLQVEPPTLPRIFRVPIYIIKQSKNSMNNRFKPYPQIKTRCVVNMDDDWDMPHAHVQYVIDVWQKQFFHQLVGFHHQGRKHGWKDGKWWYLTDNAKQVSMVLPSGFVYDAKFLQHYTNGIPASLRNIVDRDMNCDDILFNLMVSQYNHQGPVVVNYHAKVMDIGFSGGLWKDGSHFKERHQCLNEMSKIMGGMPLKYTDIFFTKETELAKTNGTFEVPSVRDIVWTDQMTL